MRGTVYQKTRNRLRRRITPACAGNRPSCHFAGPGIRDHPRVCGEQPGRGGNTGERVGSPPRVRGTGKWADLSKGKKRITPACAGNSESREIPGVAVEDHPRVCGEQPKMYPLPKLQKGSPPRVRGTGKILKIVPSSSRITPACAGNSDTGPQGPAGP